MDLKAGPSGPGSFQFRETITCKYLDKKYGIHCNYIPYGASLCHKEKKEILNRFELQPKNYFLLMARMEPENNIDTILQGFHMSRCEKKFLVIGNIATRYGRTITSRYAADKRIIFAGSLFDQDLVHTLRKNAILYFHGHSVGGTNPSLLEAMASRTAVVAYVLFFAYSLLAFLFMTFAVWLAKKLEQAPPEKKLELLGVMGLIATMFLFMAIQAFSQTLE